VLQANVAEVTDECCQHGEEDKEVIVSPKMQECAVT
jgi:hypothetical protein